MTIGTFRFGGPGITEDIRSECGYDGELLSIFSENTGLSENAGALVDKRHHHNPHYDLHRACHGQRAQMPEIGQVPSGIRLHDLIVALKKAPVPRPVHARMGER